MSFEKEEKKNYSWENTNNKRSGQRVIIVDNTRKIKKKNYVENGYKTQWLESMTILRCAEYVCKYEEIFFFLYQLQYSY